jgi:hypothetical protein
MWLVNQLMLLYPITHATVEDVRFDHYHKWKGGRAFSQVEVGKFTMYDFLDDRFSVSYIQGYETAKLRTQYNGGVDPKPKGLETKGDKSFNAHCYDSFVLAVNKKDLTDKETGEIMNIVDFDGGINTRVTFITKGRMARNGKTVATPMRRLLHRTKSKIGEKGKFYRLKRGGVKEFYTPFSRKKNKCRIKKNDSKSNHGDWDYIDNGYATKSKQF